MAAPTPPDLLEALLAGSVAVQVLHNGTLADGSTCDLRLQDGVVVEVAAPQSLSVSDGSLDLTGYVITAAGAEAHAHLDKALSVGASAPPSNAPEAGYGNLHHAIEQWRLISAGADEENYHRRAKAAALELLSNGVTAVRSHCNLIDGDHPFVGLRALVRVREELRDVMDIEIAILPAPWSPTADIAGAMDAGADIVGGCPHLSEDPEAELDRLVELAHRFGVGIDIHADEQLTPTMLSVRSLAHHVMSKPIPGTVTAGHCVSLGVLEEPMLAEVVAELAAAGVGVVTLPITNLYLQGWEHPVATPRGLTAVRALLDGGVTLAAGGDNIRDPFNPVGRADPLETASLLVVAGHLTVEESMQAVTVGGRRVMGLPEAGPTVGLVADLLACKGTSLADVVARGPGDRVVLHAGRVVSTSVSRTVVAGRSA
ncbi:cytosine deaminase [Nakamurella sp. UYEF19]|uniref:amidohydrolase family protein n=1 Tax=Nakamurella sp. UYEF19 TaxID=1756392 RepID=UPI003392B194